MKRSVMFLCLLAICYVSYAQTDYKAKGMQYVAKSDYVNAKQQFEAAKAMLQAQKIDKNSVEFIEVERLIVKAEQSQADRRDADQNLKMLKDDDSIQNSFAECSSDEAAESLQKALLLYVKQARAALNNLIKRFPADQVSRSQLEKCDAIEKSIVETKEQHIQERERVRMEEEKRLRREQQEREREARERQRLAREDALRELALKFPDRRFLMYIAEKVDTDGDGRISEKEMLAVRKIDVSNCKTIKSLEGIQYFTNLTFLSCESNELTSLDISKNTQLEFLYCGSNQLASLDVSKNTKLKSLSCYSNKLASLDVSNNVDLTTLICCLNQLTSLDVRKNTALKELDCSFNKIANLDISKNAKLESLSCGYNPIKELDVSKTNLGNSSSAFPLKCASAKDVTLRLSLKKLYLKKGWSIKGVTFDTNDNQDCISLQTKIIFVD